MMPKIHLHRRAAAHGVALLATAALSHIAAVWALPYAIMHVLMDGPQARAMAMHNQAAFPPPVSARVRTVVMPSPDLLYSVCAYDLGKGPVRIQANPQLPTYWSIALYAANSDNFFVLNDRQAQGAPVDILLVSSDAPQAALPPTPNVRVVRSPSTKGFLLMRVLTPDYSQDRDVVEPARRSLNCAPA